MVLLIGQEALDFTSPAVMPDNSINPKFNLTEHLKGRRGLLFFYPMNFAYVDPTEILELQAYLQEFENRNTAVVAISVDTYMSHLAWKERPISDGGVGPVQFPLVADISKIISKNYDVLVNDSISLRATFFLDEKGVIRYQSVQDLPLGRNIAEILRIIDSLIQYQETGHVIPAGWTRGQETIQTDKPSLNQYMTRRYQSAA